jgi:LysR family transcriptional regulator, regulator for bpeEF and oprC
LDSEFSPSINLTTVIGFCKDRPEIGKKMKLEALDNFVATVRHGSLSAAARALSIPKSTLANRVNQLETSLRVRLLERTTRTLRPTFEGQELFDRASFLLAEIAEIERSMRDREKTPRGRIRVSAPVLLEQVFMGKISAIYAARWPETEIEVVPSDKRVDLLEEGYDCAIRVGELEDSSMIAIGVARSRNIVVATPAFESALGRQISVADLTSLPVVSFGSTNGATPPWILENGDDILQIAPRSRVLLGSLHAVRLAILNGAGAALLPEFIVADDIRNMQLRQLCPEWHSPAVRISLIYPAHRHVSVRVKALAEVLKEYFSNNDLTALTSL